MANVEKLHVVHTYNNNKYVHDSNRNSAFCVLTAFAVVCNDLSALHIIT